jgi:hypothetical protein
MSNQFSRLIVIGLLFGVVMFALTGEYWQFMPLSFAYLVARAIEKSVKKG